MARLFITILLTLGLCACGSEPASSASGGAAGSVASGGSAGTATGSGGGIASGGTSPEAGAMPDAGSDADSDDYPSGPYGTEVGQVLADLELVGYLRDATTGLASEATLMPLSFDSIRASITKAYALIHIAGFT